MPNNESIKDKLLKLVLDAVKQDQARRDQYQVGDKFRFIRDKLQALVVHVQESVAELQKKVIQESQVAEDETVVYVYVYNAQGMLLKTWQKLLHPSVYYEYSVNRPIYQDKSHVEAFIRTKANKTQHGYLTVIIKKMDVLVQAPDEKPAQDLLHHPLIKVREGSLSPERFISFTHNGNQYRLNEEGELIKKEVKS